MKSTFDNIINSQIPVIVNFHADWCGPCKTLAPILKQVKDEVKDTVKIVKIDVDKNNLISEKFSIRGVPTTLLFKNGKQVWRRSGVLQKSDLISAINSNY